MSCNCNNYQNTGNKNCFSIKACQPKNCGSIGELFGKSITKECEKLYVSSKSEVFIEWCGQEATFRIRPCEFLKQNIVRSEDCIDVTLEQDPLTGECFLDLKNTSRYFLDGVAYTRGYLDNNCYWNLPITSSNNTIYAEPTEIDGIPALDLIATDPVYKFDFKDSEGNQCLVSTSDPVKFTLDSPCFTLECLPGQDGVIFKDNSNLRINNLPFDCGNIDFVDPTGFITITTDPITKRIILTPSDTCLAFNRVEISDSINGVKAFDANCDTLKFTVQDGLEINANTANKQVIIGIHSIEQSLVCDNLNSFRFWAGKTFGAPGGPIPGADDDLSPNPSIIALSSINNPAVGNYTPFVVGPYPYDVYLDVTVKIDGRFKNAGPYMGVTLMALFNGNWVVTSPVSTTTPTGDTGGSGPFVNSGGSGCDLPAGCERGLNIQHRALARLSAGGVATVDAGIFVFGNGGQFGLQSRSVFLQIRKIC